MKKNINIFCQQCGFSPLWFTLIEIMVAITIFMIVMVSVMQIFGISSQLTYKIDINRQMQENIKNLTETINEDIRNYWITEKDFNWDNNWVKKEIVDSYSINSLDNWSILKILDNKYYLSIDEESYSILWDNEISNKCSDIKNNCFLVKEFLDWTKSKLTNSWVAFEDLNFIIMGNDMKKIVINFTMRPSSKKWVPTNLIKNSKVIFQTTISERFVKTN